MRKKYFSKVLGGGGCCGKVVKMSVTRITSVHPLAVCFWDSDTGVYIATSDDVAGLVTEAETLEALKLKVYELIPLLLEENSNNRPI